MNSVNVNHVMFTEKMVPMLTTVDIAATRIPTFGAVDPAVEKSFADLNAKYRKTTKK